MPITSVSASGSCSNLPYSRHGRPAKSKKPKLAISLGLIFLVIALALGFYAYKESWLDPFSTLNVPNQELHPRSIKMVGMVTSEDPFHPFYTTDEKSIQALLRCLQNAIPISAADLTSAASADKKVLYFTLHREAAKYYGEEDFALHYYPEEKTVFFGQQFFQIDETTAAAFSQTVNKMTPGWWYAINSNLNHTPSSVDPQA